MYKYFISLFFFVSTSAGAGLFGYDSFEECKFEKSKECTTNACISMAVDLCETDFPYQKSGDWVLYESGTLSSNTQFTPEPVNFYVKIVLKNNNLVTGPKTVSLTLIKSESSKGDRRDDFLKLPIKDFVDRYEPFEVYLQWFDNGEGEYSAIRSGTTYEIYRAKRERKAKGWFD